jgi:hypothetical protein
MTLIVMQAPRIEKIDIEASINLVSDPPVWILSLSPFQTVSASTTSQNEPNMLSNLLMIYFAVTHMWITWHIMLSAPVYEVMYSDLSSLSNKISWICSY